MAKEEIIKVVKGWAVYDTQEKRMTGAFQSKFDLDQAMYLEDCDLILRCTITYKLPQKI